jgi:general secretion pathway protein G
MTTIRNLIEARRADKEDEGGFTLIELLIVVVVLGILAAIVVFAVQNLTGQSAQAACKSDGKTVETGLEAQRAQVPSTVVGSNGYNTTIGSLAPNYIRSVPNSAKYTISLGTNVAGTATNPDAGGAVTDFAAGKVLVSLAAAPAVFFDLNRPGAAFTATTGNPCSGVV